MVSAALSQAGVPREALAKARSSGRIALSVAVFREISEVLARPKFARLIPSEQRAEILELLTTAAVWTEPDATVRECRDQKDDIYLALASASKAVAIVSGDQDLLTMDPWRGIRILRPAEFLTATF